MSEYFSFIFVAFLFLALLPVLLSINDRLGKIIEQLSVIIKENK